MKGKIPLGKSRTASIDYDLKKISLLTLAINIALFIVWSVIGPSDIFMIIFGAGGSMGVFVGGKLGIDILRGHLGKWIMYAIVIVLNTFSWIFILISIRYFLIFLKSSRLKK